MSSALKLASLAAKALPGIMDHGRSLQIPWFRRDRDENLKLDVGGSCIQLLLRNISPNTRCWHSIRSTTNNFAGHFICLVDWRFSNKTSSVVLHKRPSGAGSLIGRYGYTLTGLSLMPWRQRAPSLLPHKLQAGRIRNISSLTPWGPAPNSTKFRTARRQLNSALPRKIWRKVKALSNHTFLPTLPQIAFEQNSRRAKL